MAGLSGQFRLEMVVTKNWRGWSIRSGIRKRLMEYPMVRREVENGQLTLHGWHYVIEEGEVHVFDVLKGGFVPASMALNSGTGPYQQFVEHDGQLIE